MNAIDPHTIQYLRGLSADPSFLPVLIDAFTRDTKAEISQMKEAYQCHDTQTLRHLAHKSKSSSRSLGAETLATICLEIENMARDGKGDLPIVAEKIRLMEAEAQRAVNELKAYGLQ
ncbi:MAG: Hpt domain-containing protein [Bacteroidetes bacterium]|nr:MAG: Hpt domain-containing protein [Bacteroidota bacterium]